MRDSVEKIVVQSKLHLIQTEYNDETCSYNKMRKSNRLRDALTVPTYGYGTRYTYRLLPNIVSELDRLI